MTIRALFWKSLSGNAAHQASPSPSTTHRLVADPATVLKGRVYPLQHEGFDNGHPTARRALLKSLAQEPVIEALGEVGLERAIEGHILWFVLFSTAARDQAIRSSTHGAVQLSFRTALGGVCSVTAATPLVTKNPTPSSDIRHPKCCDHATVLSLPLFFFFFFFFFFFAVVPVAHPALDQRAKTRVQRVLLVRFGHSVHTARCRSCARSLSM